MHFSPACRLGPSKLRDDATDCIHLPAHPSVDAPKMHIFQLMMMGEEWLIDKYVGTDAYFYELAFFQICCQHLQKTGLLSIYKTGCRCTKSALLKSWPSRSRAFDSMSLFCFVSTSATQQNDLAQAFRSPDLCAVKTYSEACSETKERVFNPTCICFPYLYYGLWEPHVRQEFGLFQFVHILFFPNLVAEEESFAQTPLFVSSKGCAEHISVPCVLLCACVQHLLCVPWLVSIWLHSTPLSVPLAPPLDFQFGS